MNAPAFVWLIALPLAASPAIYLLGRVRRLGSVAPQGLALGALAGSALALAMSARDFAAAGAATFRLGTVALRFDGLSVLVAALALVLGSAVVVFSGRYMQSERGVEKYYALVAALVGTVIGLACASDLFNLWLWFEAMALSSYLLVAFYRTQPASLEAGVKYLVQSATGSALVLLGIALVLAETGTLDLAPAQVAAPGPLPLAAGALFICGFGVKAALVPLHTWLPDAHAQAPSGISALLSGVVIEAGLLALLRALGPIAPLVHADGKILMLLGALNMGAGNLLALQQAQLKRMLAFSSIAQVGYMLLGVGMSIDTGQLAGAQGGFFHLLNHGLMKGLAFLAAGALLYALHGARPNAHGAPLKIAELAGAAQRYPLAALSLSIALLALGGLPPLAGFMSKWQIFAAGFDTHDALIGGLVIFAALNSVVSLAYYAPPVNALYRRQPSALVLAGQPLPLTMSAPLGVLALLIVLIGLWPGALNGLTAQAAAALMEMLR